MSDEKKNEKTEDVKEEVRELSSDELRKVTGGADSCEILMCEDKAEEATEYAKAQVYRQAAKAMLAQVNSKPADVFGLFQ